MLRYSFARRMRDDQITVAWKERNVSRTDRAFVNTWVGTEEVDSERWPPFGPASFLPSPMPNFVTGERMTKRWEFDPTRKARVGLSNPIKENFWIQPTNTSHRYLCSPYMYDVQYCTHEFVSLLCTTALPNCAAAATVLQFSHLPSCQIPAPVEIHRHSTLENICWTMKPRQLVFPCLLRSLWGYLYWRVKKLTAKAAVSVSAHWWPLATTMNKQTTLVCLVSRLTGTIQCNNIYLILITRGRNPILRQCWKGRWGGRDIQCRLVKPPDILWHLQMFPRNWDYGKNWRIHVTFLTVVRDREGWWICLTINGGCLFRPFRRNCRRTRCSFTGRCAYLSHRANRSVSRTDFRRFESCKKGLISKLFPREPVVP